ncbi:unnamed protein product [Soboliphyme baturini]|uniref:KH domain-containing protein n=1 Tax=Soboliphyme baturini TaxID=241478 RepID=A0A183IW73_9BILA|nr:unnamed protein product [Soboliphyme baturini]
MRLVFPLFRSYRMLCELISYKFRVSMRCECVGIICKYQNSDGDVFYMHVPANKTGLVIGKGGETIKQIASESGARVELSRDPAPNDREKVFIIKGTPQQIHHASHLIRIRVGDV